MDIYSQIIVHAFCHMWYTFILYAFLQSILKTINNIDNLIWFAFIWSSDDRPAENKSLPSSADEGFEDSRSGDFTRSPPLSQVPFIDFRKSKKTRREEVIHFCKNVL